VPTPRLLADRRCAWGKCGKVFRPKCATRVCCSLSCAGHYNHARHPDVLARGKVTAIANGTMRMRRRVEALVWQQFKDLSDREIALFDLGLRVGWQRGYNRRASGERRQYRKKKAAA
jgi:hypothetical protein